MAQEPFIPFAPIEVQVSGGRAFKVVEYTDNDFKSLVQMYKDFEPKRKAQGLPPPDVPRIAHWLDRLHRKSWALLAMDGPRVVGHAILCPASDASVEFTVFVHQDFRRLGLGTELVRLAVDYAERAGFAELLLTTDLANLPALCVYKKVGFRIRTTFGNECEMRLALAYRHRAEAA
jgi:ribosomal protein S18 acetylase RimI-like enzyme